MGQKVYLFEAVIECPRELWDKHKDLPFLAELRVIDKRKCVDKRKNAASINLKNFYKLMINGVYGKTMKNVRKH